MPYARETLTDLRNQAVQDINAANIQDQSGNRLGILLQKAVLRVVAWVQAGLAFLHYEYLDYIAKQATPWGATDEYAAGWGGLIGVTQKDATFATGSATFTGTATTDIPVGTSITRSDGFAYVSTADAVVQLGGAATVPITAVQAGSAGNSDAGTVLRLANPIAGVNSSGSAAAAITGGADQEDPGAFKTRYLQQYAARPQGGDRSDYVEWALEVPGVTRAWVNPNGFGTGTVVVYVMLDQAEASNGGFPQGTNGVAAAEPRDAAASGDQLAVANSIYAVQPVTALVYACAPTAQPQAFTIANLGANNTTAMQAAIQAALADMFLRLGNVGGTVNPQTGQAWPAIDPNDWYSALAAIPGLTKFAVPSPAAPITPSAGNLLTVGALTFSS